jgi:hypothetical protein
MYWRLDAVLCTVKHTHVLLGKIPNRIQKLMMGCRHHNQRDLHTTRRDLAGCGQGVDEIESYQNNRSKCPVSFYIVKEDHIY